MSDKWKVERTGPDTYEVSKDDSGALLTHFGGLGILLLTIFLPVGILYLSYKFRKMLLLLIAVCVLISLPIPTTPTAYFTQNSVFHPRVLYSVRPPQQFIWFSGVVISFVVVKLLNLQEVRRVDLIGAVLLGATPWILSYVVPINFFNFSFGSPEVLFGSHWILVAATAGLLCSLVIEQRWNKRLIITLAAVVGDLIAPFIVTFFIGPLMINTIVNILLSLFPGDTMSRSVYINTYYIAFGFAFAMPPTIAYVWLAKRMRATVDEELVKVSYGGKPKPFTK